MQWHRGIGFAFVHLSVALPMVAGIEANEANGLRLMHAQESPSGRSKPLAVSAGEASNGAPDFSPCGMIDTFSPSENILIFANPGAFLVTDWRSPCARRWSVSGMLISDGWPKASWALFAKGQRVDAIFIALMAIQWLLIGVFPLRPHCGLWGDPATHITICTVAAGALSFIPNIESFCNFPMLYAAAAWVWWLYLLGSTLLSRTWRLATSRFAAHQQ